MGITTILIAGLVMSSGTLLEVHSNQGAEQSLETVGERLAGELERADQLATTDDDTVNITADHPQTVAGSSYTVELQEDCDDPLLDTGGEYNCIRLSSNGADAAVHVPVSNEIDLDTDGPVTGGTIEIRHSDGEVAIR
ncbi:hypothetical protein ACLI4Z_11670 [Natrialbaceae archaeon A-arb3/5]